MRIFLVLLCTLLWSTGAVALPDRPAPVAQATPGPEAGPLAVEDYFLARDIRGADLLYGDITLRNVGKNDINVECLRVLLYDGYGKDLLQFEVAIPGALRPGAKVTIPFNYRYQGLVQMGHLAIKADGTSNNQKFTVQSPQRPFSIGVR